MDELDGAPAGGGRGPVNRVVPPSPRREASRSATPARSESEGAARGGQRSASPQPPRRERRTGRVRQRWGRTNQEVQAAAVADNRAAGNSLNPGNQERGRSPERAPNTERGRGAERAADPTPRAVTLSPGPGDRERGQGREKGKGKGRKGKGGKGQEAGKGRGRKGDHGKAQKGRGAKGDAKGQQRR